MVKLLLPQEVETFYIIPALRKHIAIALKKSGMKQKDVADILQVNSAAISQYSSSKRGSRVKFTKDIIESINESSTRITNSHTYLRETQRLLSFIRRNNFLCQVHKQLSDLPKDCEPDSMGCHLTAVGGCNSWN